MPRPQASSLALARSAGIVAAVLAVLGGLLIVGGAVADLHYLSTLAALGGAGLVFAAAIFGLVALGALAVWGIGRGLGRGR